MCGRYDLGVTGGMLAARFGVSLSQANEDLQPRYNIAPSQLNPVIVTGVTPDDQGRQLVRMKWGLVSGSSKEPKTNFSTINARAETVTQKPAFRKLLFNRRCLVPATGYFEWAENGVEGKQPYRVQVTADGAHGNSPEGKIVAMAGLYDVWRGHNGEDGGDLLTYTIITTEASARIRGLHERMPVILSREDEEAWPNPTMMDKERLLRLLRPYPDEKLRAYRVGRGVGSWASPNSGPGNDRADLIRAA